MVSWGERGGAGGGMKEGCWASLVHDDSASHDNAGVTCKHLD